MIVVFNRYFKQVFFLTPSPYAPQYYIVDRFFELLTWFAPIVCQTNEIPTDHYNDKIGIVFYLQIHHQISTVGLFLQILPQLDEHTLGVVLPELLIESNHFWQYCKKINHYIRESGKYFKWQTLVLTLWNLNWRM